MSGSLTRSPAYSASINFPPTVASTIPVQPLLGASSARYSSAVMPTEDDLTRSGKSLVTRTTSFPSLTRFFATARILESFVPSRKKPCGRDEVSLWFSSTERVPPEAVICIGRSSRPWEIRKSSN